MRICQAFRAGAIENRLLHPYPCLPAGPEPNMVQGRQTLPPAGEGEHYLIVRAKRPVVEAGVEGLTSLCVSP